jgi:poly-gamma-glutamate capsule biosynthesis protein CapA/YwtB (metallophosphatase superfamily)
MLRKKNSFLFFLIAIMIVSAICHGCKQQDNSIRIYFAGDLLLDRGVRKQITVKGVAPLFEKVKPLFEGADAVVVNLECPVTKLSSPINKKYIFRAEPEWLQVVKQSDITHLVMANNHTCDQGRNGIKETAEHLIDADLIPVGYGINQDDACKPTRIEKNGMQVALFSSVLLPLENWPYLPDSIGVCQATVEDLKNRIKAFKIENPNYKIVIILHWGSEFQETPLFQQRQQAEELVDAGADAIIGHHPHVIQSKSIYKGKPIFFSIGNFVFDQEYEAATKALMVELIFSNEHQEFAVHPIVIKNCVPTPVK